MNIEDILKIAGAIIASLGGGALIVAAFSGWLGKVWASRILESDRAKYKTAIEILKSGLEKKSMSIMSLYLELMSSVLMQYKSYIFIL